MLTRTLSAGHGFNYSIIREVAHRPWPMRDTPWLMTQTWNDLLFAHWRVDAKALRNKVPSAFEIDRFEGEAWLGIVPFHMTNVGPRGVPVLPWLSAFPELNVRTYVRIRDRPGVYFFSLDAGSALAVRTARVLLNLPYYRAMMAVQDHAAGVSYESVRVRGAGPAEFSATYEPMSAPFAAAPGSLEYFLTERYCLYNTFRNGEPYRLDVHHPPWPLQRARASIDRNSMAAACGIVLSGEPPLVHFVKRQDAVAWAPLAIE